MGFYNNQPAGHEEKGECFICGGEPDAFWVGHTTTFICSTCAVDVLPKLTSDAIMNKLTIWQIIDGHIFGQFKREKDILLSLARGFECAILRKARDYYKKPKQP